MNTFTLKENEKLTAEIIDGCAVFTIEEKKKEFKGKLMDEKPLFINSRGTKFYMDDDIYWVNKITNNIYSESLTAYHRALEEHVNQTEALTKEQAEQYVKDNRVFEDREWYWAFEEKNVSEDKYPVQFYNGNFLVAGSSVKFKEHEFLKIGEKITF